MAFDMGFDFRGTSGFVTDPAYGVPVIGEGYPHTYTNANGDSVNAGWGAAVNMYNAAAGNDPRIAGINYVSGTGANPVFHVDLSSGSAPGAGTYQIDLAMGEADFANIVDFKLLDNTTVLIDGTNGGPGFATAIGHFIDATLTDVAASTTWTGTPVTKVFATTTAFLGMDYAALGSFCSAAHFRLTLQGGAAQSVVPVVMAQYRQRWS